MSSPCEVAIVGSGPYGLSLAAYLRARGIAYRIFGPPMESWADHMPAGMSLKSEGFASNLYDPSMRFTLEGYCAKRGIRYDHSNIPVTLELFVNYGRAFQEEMVPNLENKRVTGVHRTSEGFVLDLDSGETVNAAKVVMATGITASDYVPSLLSSLPAEVCTHSYDQQDLSKFRGREVIVVGSGSSASDAAAILHAQGASVQLLSRRPPIFHTHSEGKRSLWQRIKNPNLGLGPNLRSAVFTAAPDLYRNLSFRLREGILRRHLGPAGGWFMRDLVIGKVTIHSGYELQRAEAHNGRVTLTAISGDGQPLKLDADFVLAATGYRPDLARMKVLDSGLLAAVRVENGYPAVSRSYESSVPGLYFIGLASALTFGPLMRFALGARFAAKRVAAHLASRRARSAVRADSEGSVAQTR